MVFLKNSFFSVNFDIRKLKKLDILAAKKGPPQSTKILKRHKIDISGRNLMIFFHSEAFFAKITNLDMRKLNIELDPRIFQKTLKFGL